jgi:lysophospholipase L1-like esterase
VNRAITLALLVFLFPPVFVPAHGETNHDFARWEKEVAAYESADRTNPPPRDALLFIGSSTIRLWTTLAGDFPGRAVINRGFGGSQIVDSTHFADRLIFPHRPRMIVFRAGGNDLWEGKPPAEVFADFTNFVATVHGQLPRTDVVFISWNPSPARWKQADREKVLNAMVEAFAERTQRLKYIETYDLVLGPDGRPRPELFSADQLHFSAKGYQLLADRVRLRLPE